MFLCKTLPTPTHPICTGFLSSLQDALLKLKRAMARGFFKNAIMLADVTMVSVSDGDGDGESRSLHLLAAKNTFS